MSFGFSSSDLVLLVHLAWTTVQNSRKACGEHAELTCEMKSLHVNLQRLKRESAKVESPINRPSDTCREDLAPIVNGCGKALDVLDRILEKYNALSDGERSKGKLWKAVRFGNGELANVKDLRSKLVYYTANLSLFLNMVSMGSMGIVEKQMCEAGGDLKEIRRAVNNITAHLITGANKEGSVLTDYADDDKAVWRAFRRELVEEGFSSDVIREHKDTIQAYVKELGSRGILDDNDLNDSGKFSEEIEDTELAQATPKARDEAMGSFESKSGAARDGVSPRAATTAYVDNLSGTGNRDPGENETISQKTQIAPASLTMNKERQQWHQYTDDLVRQKEELVRQHTLETADLRRKNTFLIEEAQRLESISMSTQSSSAGESTGFPEFEHLTMDSSPFDDFSFIDNPIMGPEAKQETSTTQADAEINSVVERGSREAEKIDDRTNRNRSSAPIPPAEDLTATSELLESWRTPSAALSCPNSNY